MMRIALFAAILLLVTSSAKADVYVFKGLGGVWSAGLAEACAYLRERKRINCHFETEPPKNSGRPVVLVGHSLGGSTAINHAMYNRVSTVILLDPVGSAHELRAGRIVLVQSANWHSHGPNGSVRVQCDECSHTNMDDNSRIQFIIIREAMAAHGQDMKPSPVEHLAQATIPATPRASAAPPAPSRKWRRRR